MGNVFELYYDLINIANLNFFSKTTQCPFKQKAAGIFQEMYEINYQLFINCLLENSRILLPNETGILSHTFWGNASAL